MKLIDKILDDYLARRILDNLARDIQCIYNFDTKIEKYNKTSRRSKEYSLYVKPKLYKDSECKVVFSVLVDRAVILTMNYYETLNRVRDNIKSLRGTEVKW